MILRTHCSVRLGDNLLALHLLRGFARANPEVRFIHFAHLAYVHQLAEMVCDLGNLQVCDLESVSEPADFWHMAPRPLFRSVDMWKNAGGYWEKHPLKLDYAQFALGYGMRIAEQLGLTSPWRAVQDLLFDAPAIGAFEFPEFDVLVVNSAPQSGQLPGFDRGQMELLVGELAQRYSVWTTARTRHAPCTIDRNLTVAQIGALSRFCRVVVMVATGSAWCTFNVFNQTSIEHRIILLEPERVNLAPNTVHVADAAEARRMLQLKGVL